MFKIIIVGSLPVYLCTMFEVEVFLKVLNKKKCVYSLRVSCNNDFHVLLASTVAKYYRLLNCQFVMRCSDNKLHNALSIRLLKCRQYATS